MSAGTARPGRFGRHVAAASLGFALVAVGRADADSAVLRAVPVPEGAERVVLAADIVRDGRLTSIARLATSASVEATLDVYREAWPATDADPGHIEERAGNWSIVSRLSGDALVVVQLRDGANGTEGLISAAAIEPVGASSIEPPPLPSGARLLSTTETREGGRVASTAIVFARTRPGEVSAFYRDRLVRDGWTLARDTISDGTPVLLLDRRGAHVEVVVSALAGGSVAVVNEVRDGE